MNKKYSHVSCPLSLLYSVASAMDPSSFYSHMHTSSQSDINLLIMFEYVSVQKIHSKKICFGVPAQFYYLFKYLSEVAVSCNTTMDL